MVFGVVDAARGNQLETDSARALPLTIATSESFKRVYLHSTDVGLDVVKQGCTKVTAS